MYPSIQAHFPAPGSIVSVPITLGYRHLGVVSDRFQNGMSLVISNSSRTGGVTEEPWNVFAQGHPVTVERFPSKHSGLTIVTRARSKIGTPYDLLKWNCEHLVSFAQGKAPASPQMSATLSIAALVLLFVGFKGV